ncbi:MAG: flagellar filament capping protein FliD, partial [Planctomycetales bacterium]|nr:flagellar filament capping protein FliD [Planctomycetales bacterium]
KNVIQQRQAAFKTIEAKVLSLRADAGVLSRNANNPLTRQSVTTSDEKAIIATATSSAAAGVYRLTVNSTAQTHQIASQGLADADSQITQGTFEVRLGAGEPKSITIDGNNDTLSGLAAAINSAGTGVSASIVQDSSGGTTPFRLLLTSSRSGTSNEIKVTNSLGVSNGTAIRPEIDFLTPVQTASDARVTLGSGAGAISVTSSTNQFKDAIGGVSFDLLQANSGDVVSLTVAKDNIAAVTAVESFVESFNDVVQYVDDNSKYSVEKKVGGLLLGNQNAGKIVETLRSTIANPVPGANPLANRLSAVGVNFNDKGRLTLNKSKLDDALNGKIEGVTAEDVKKLFSLGGKSSNAGVTFVLGSTRTKATTTGYGFDISQAAEQGSITGGTSAATATVVTAANRMLELKLDGKTATVSLSEGTYTSQELANHVESVVNASTDLPGRQLSVSLSSGALKFTSAKYGLASEVEIVGGTAVSDLGFVVGQNNKGRDVVGSFIVDGKTEAAVGRGRLLSGDLHNENTADLQVQVTLGPTQVAPGIDGTITVSRGLASALDQTLGKLLDNANGLLASVDDGFDGQLKSLQSSIDRQTNLFGLQEASIRKQFQALETAISQLNSTSSYLGGQLANLPKVG